VPASQLTTHTSGRRTSSGMGLQLREIMRRQDAGREAWGLSRQAGNVGVALSRHLDVDSETRVEGRGSRRETGGDMRLATGSAS
jgi:hypothetical protein